MKALDETGDEISVLEGAAVSVRAATVGDAPAIAGVHVTSWQAAYKCLLPDDLLAALSVERRTKNWQRILQDASQETLVYENSGEVVAFTNFGPCRDEDKDPETVAELMTIYAERLGPGRGQEFVAGRLGGDAEARLS